MEEGTATQFEDRTNSTTNHRIGEDLLNCTLISNMTQGECDQWATYYSFRLVLEVFLVAPICIIGFKSNLLAIVVLSSRGAINSTLAFLLQALAVADNIYLLSCFVIQVMKALHELTDWIPPEVGNWFAHLEWYAWPLASTAQTAAVWLVVIVTFNRYFAICRPMMSWSYCCCLRSRVGRLTAVASVFIAAFLYNIPRFFERQVLLSNAPYENGTAEVQIALIEHTDFRNENIYFVLYKTVAYFVFRSGIPLVTIFVLNILLMRTMRGRRMSICLLRQTSYGQRQRKTSVTLLLVSMISVFIVCELPSLLLRVVLAAYQFTGQSMNVSTMYGITVTNFLLTVNSSINCFVYCLSGRQFRRILFRLLKCGSSSVNRTCCSWSSLQQVWSSSSSSRSNRMSRLSSIITVFHNR